MRVGRLGLRLAVSSPVRGGGARRSSEPLLSCSPAPPNCRIRCASRCTRPLATRFLTTEVMTLTTPSPDVAEAEAAMAAGMAAFRERQAPALDPMGGAELRPAESTLQPWVPDDRGDQSGGVT